MHLRHRRVDDVLGHRFYLDQSYFLQVLLLHLRMFPGDTVTIHRDAHQLHRVHLYQDALVVEPQNLDVPHRDVSQPSEDAHLDAKVVVLVDAEPHHRLRTDCCLDAVDVASRSQDLYPKKMDYCPDAADVASE